MLINLEDTEIWKLTNGTLDNHVTCEIDDKPYEEVACWYRQTSASLASLITGTLAAQAALNKKVNCWDT